MRSILIPLLTFCATLSYGQNSFQKHFESFSVSGSMTIYDYKSKKWIFTDSIDSYREMLPASTFKILNSLIALENKVVKDENFSTEIQGFNWGSITSEREEGHHKKGAGR